MEVIMNVVSFYLVLMIIGTVFVYTHLHNTVLLSFPIFFIWLFLTSPPDHPFGGFALTE